MQLRIFETSDFPKAYLPTAINRGGIMGTYKMQTGFNGRISVQQHSLTLKASVHAFIKKEKTA